MLFIATNYCLELKISLQPAFVMQPFYHMRHTLYLCLDLAVMQAALKCLECEICFIEEHISGLGIHFAVVFALFEQFPKVRLIAIQRKTAGQIIMAGADYIVFIQQLIGHKCPDIAKDNIHIAITPKVIIPDIIGKDMAVSRFKVAQFIACIYRYFESQRFCGFCFKPVK